MTHILGSPVNTTFAFPKMVYKLTTLLQEDFIAPLSWSPPQELPKLPFTQLFDLLKNLPPSMDIIDLEQQLQTIIQLSEWVKESLCGAPCLHCHLEEKDTNTHSTPVYGMIPFLNIGTTQTLPSMTL